MEEEFTTVPPESEQYKQIADKITGFKRSYLQSLTFRTKLPEIEINHFLGKITQDLPILAQIIQDPKQTPIMLDCLGQLFFLSAAKPDFSDLAVGLVQNNFTALENLFHQSTSVHIKSGIGGIISESVVYAEGSDSRTELYRQKAIEFLVTNISTLATSSRRQKEAIFTMICNYANVPQLQKALPVIVDFINNPFGEVKKPPKDFKKVKYEHRQSWDLPDDLSMFKSILGHIDFGKSGLDFTVLQDGWRKAGGKIEILLKNLQTIYLLESQEPGICKTLMKEFGIVNFGRYPTELLFRAYDERDNKKDPYGIIIYPVADHNGAFYQHPWAFRELSKQLATNNYQLRVYEGSKIGYARALISANRRYQHKISFAIIGGHGNPSSFRIDAKVSNSRTDSGHTVTQEEADTRHVVTKEEIAKLGFSGIADYFEPNPTIILLSCSTGEKDGIAQEMSKVGAKVLAPNKPAILKEMRVWKNSDTGLRFAVSFQNPNPNFYKPMETVTYFQGKPLEENL